MKLYIISWDKEKSLFDKIVNTDVCMLNFSELKQTLVQDILYNMTEQYGTHDKDYKMGIAEGCAQAVSIVNYREDSPQDIIDLAIYIEDLGAKLIVLDAKEY